MEADSQTESSEANQTKSMTTTTNDDAPQAPTPSNPPPDQPQQNNHINNKQQTSEVDPSEPTAENGTTLSNLTSTVDALDDNLDEAFGQAADSFWNFATSVTGKVTSVVKEGQPGLENLRKNVSSRLAPLDTFGRDLTSQIGALAQSEKPLANLAGSVKSVAASVQKNAQAMEAAILAKANQVDGSSAVLPDESDSTGVVISDYSVGMVPMSGGDENKDELVDVNKEIAKVGESISNSIVGQTVGGLWSGLWENIAGAEEDPDGDNRDQVPKTRFEKRIYELQANPDTYCEPAKDLDAFEHWGKTFVLDDHADSCIAILDTHPEIADLYERVVPEVVEEDTFWMRYFFAKYTLELEEERRKKLLARAENAVVEEEGEDGWGDDDWDENMAVQADSAKEAPGSTDNPPLPSAEEDTKSPQPGDSKKPETAEKPSRDGAKMPTSKAGDAVAQGSVPSSKEPKATEPVVAATTGEDDWGDDDWE